MVEIIADIGMNYLTMDDLLDGANMSKHCGCDVFKIQYFDKADLWPGAVKGPYIPGEDSRIKKEKINLDLLKQYCDNAGVEFMASVFNVNDVPKLDKYVKRWKLASCEAQDFRLLEEISKTKKPIIVSTGAYKNFSFLFNKMFDFPKVTLLYCVSNYPARTIDVRQISKLRERYNCDVGFSDHSIEYPNLGLEAKRLGATMIERHFNPCFMNSIQSQDGGYHALEPKEMADYCSAIKKNLPIKNEISDEIIMAARRRPIALKAFEPGDEIQKNEWIFARYFGAKKRRDKEVNQDFHVASKIVANKSIIRGDILDGDNCDIYPAL